jgi:hypothetical protein
MLTTREGRKRAAAKAIFDKELLARIDRERNTPSDEQRRKALMQSCIAEAEAEQNAAREKELAPVRRYEQTLNADREQKARNARYELTLPDYAYFLECGCPPFSEYKGKEGDYLDAVRNTFVNEFQPYLERTGVTLTQAGLESLAALSEDNLGLDWTNLRTFQLVFEHTCAVGFAKEGRDFTVTEQKQQEPQPQEESRREPQTYDELRNAADAEYLAMARPVWNDFQTYLMENWGVALTASQQHEALETAKRLNLNPCIPDSWITVKNNLVRRQVLPECRTVDERLSAFIETVPDVSSPTGRRAIAEERNRLMSEEYKKH